MAAYLELGAVPAEFLPQAVDPNVLKEISKIRIYKPNVIKPAPKPYPLMTTQAPKEGFFDTVLNFVDRTVDKGSTILNKIGQAKAQINTIKTRADAGINQWENDWRNNIIETPRDTRGDWITGIPNGLVIAGVAGLGILFIVMANREK